MAKWVALLMTVGLWALTWPQIMPPHDDLPPCHMMLLIIASGGFTLWLFHRDRLEKRK